MFTEDEPLIGLVSIARESDEKLNFFASYMLVCRDAPAVVQDVDLVVPALEVIDEEEETIKESLSE